MRTTAAKLIRAPPAKVFDYIADMRNDSAWAPLVSNVKQIKGDGPGVGSVWEFDQRVGAKVRRMKVEMVTCEKPALIVWRGVESKANYESSMMFAPHKYGTAISQVNVVSTGLPWYGRIIARIYSGKILRKQMKNLGKILGNGR